MFDNLSAQVNPVKIYIRGTGLNRHSPRVLKIGDQIIYQSSGRGLRLTVLDKSNMTVVLDQIYDSYGSGTASESLAEKLNAISMNQMGVLTSCDAWEVQVTPNLDKAFLRLGLTIATATNISKSRRPYAAIFEGASNGESTGRAVEVSYEPSANMPYAEIRGFLIEGAFVASGNQSNALFYPQGNGVSVITDCIGNVGVGTTSPTHKLDVNGTIRAKEIKVEAQPADFVFEDDYNLRSLNDVQAFIKANKHLPDIPSASEMKADDVDLAEMNKLLLMKIEELTLYAIEKDKEVALLIRQVEKHEEESSNVEKRLAQIEALLMK